MASRDERKAAVRAAKHSSQGRRQIVKPVAATVRGAVLDGALRCETAAVIEIDAPLWFDAAIGIGIFANIGASGRKERFWANRSTKE